MRHPIFKYAFEGSIATVEAGPFDTYTARYEIGQPIYDDVERMHIGKELYGIEGPDDKDPYEYQKNALRHCWWSCALHSMWPDHCEDADQVLNAHEAGMIYKSEMDKRDTMEDLWNNNAGKRVAKPGLGRDGCKEACVQALKAGDLVVDHQDPRPGSPLDPRKVTNIPDSRY